MKCCTKCAQETFALGEKLGQSARPGQVFTLTGGLGVGKTVFAQGMAAGLGISEPVCSPTASTRAAVFPFIILMYIESQMWKKWKRSAARIVSTDRGSAWWNGRS